MKKIIIPALLATQFINAQKVNLIIKAEKEFAQQALDSGFNKSFLNNLDSNAVTFDNGEIIKGIEHFKKNKEPQIKLIWEPLYAASSISEDFGFTTGPYEIKQAVSGKVIGAGQYHSIWKKNKNDQWKVVVDLGIDYEKLMATSDKVIEPFRFQTITPGKDTYNYIRLEKEFIDKYEQIGAAAFLTFMREGSRLDVQNHLPIKNIDEIKKAVNAFPPNLKFKMVDGGMSASKDFAYAYGTVSLNEKKQNYLRIWSHTQEGWILVLQVLTLQLY